MNLKIFLIFSLGLVTLKCSSANRNFLLDSDEDLAAAPPDHYDGSSSEHAHAETSGHEEALHPQAGPTELPPPPQPPTIPTPSTTIPPRVPLPFEKFTTDLIRQNNASIEVLQLNLARYETQLNLNALNTLLPELRELRKNMSSLLTSPLPTSPHSFENQSKALDTKLTEVELQINKNRRLLHRFEQIQSDTQRQLGIVYASLGNILLSQVNILSDEALPINPDNPPIKTEGEIRYFIEEAFINYFSTGTTAERIQKFLGSLQTPENRLLAHNLTLQKMRTEHLTLKDNFLVGVARNVFKYPELSELKSLLPDRAQKIFTTEAKVIEMRTSSRKLTLRANGTPFVTSLDRLPASTWTFLPLESSQAFAIIYTRSSSTVALGVRSNSTISTRADVTSKTYVGEATVKDDRFYQWQIQVYYRTDNRGYYLKFINSQTGFALDAYTNDVVALPASSAGTQDWELH